MTRLNSVVAIYQTHVQAEHAVKSLQRAQFDMKQISIIGRDYHTEEHVVGYYNTGDRMMYWGKFGANPDRFATESAWNRSRSLPNKTLPADRSAVTTRGSMVEADWTASAGPVGRLASTRVMNRQK